MERRRTHVIIWMVVKMKFSIFASGSKGNCTYIQAGSTQLVIDCGMTKRYLTHAFHCINVDLEQIDALLITHTHSDHISQLKVFKNVNCIVAPSLLEIREDSQVWMPYIKDADYYIIESNHDVDLLMKSNRPYLTKQRILSDTGHLSNEDCAYILSQVITSKTKEIVLAHLSQEANQPELAIHCVYEALEREGLIPSDYSIRCASQSEIVQGGLYYEEVTNYESNLSITHLE